MKKVLFNSFLLVACLAVFSSCAKEEVYEKNIAPIQSEEETSKVISTDVDDQDSYDHSHSGGCGN